MAARPDRPVRPAGGHAPEQVCVSVISTHGGEELVLSINGALDLRLAAPLWKLSAPERAIYTSYIVDLRGVDEVFGSGLACLMMFARRMNRYAGEVRVLTPSSALASRCAELLASDIVVRWSPSRRSRRSLGTGPLRSAARAHGR